jgi:hypothetical protein
MASAVSLCLCSVSIWLAGFAWYGVKSSDRVTEVISSQLKNEFVLTKLSFWCMLALLLIHRDEE